jgi:hypothetical protein
MTLIVTVISDFGIIQASDSHLTTADGRLLEPAAKVFNLDFAHGALAYFGRYGVDGRPIDRWMHDCIRDYGETNDPTIEGFARHLQTRLEREVSDDERQEGMMVQIAGYTEADGARHPEMWFVRNLDMESTGEYSDGGVFKISEDFWGRDYPKWLGAKPTGADPVQQYYFNGYSEGRIAYYALSQTFRSFYQQVWNHPGWHFRPPQTLEQLASFVRLEISSVVTIFGSSDYPTPPIGGEVQLEAFAPPTGAITLL